MTGVSAAFEYVTQCHVTDRKAAKVMAGWSADDSAFGPRLEGIAKCDPTSEEYDVKFDQTVLDGAIYEMFGGHSAHLERGVMRMLFATFLRFGHRFAEKYGVDNIIMKPVLDICNSFGITNDNFFKDLCADVQNDFKQRNFEALALEDNRDKSVRSKLQNPYREHPDP